MPKILLPSEIDYEQPVQHDWQCVPTALRYHPVHNYILTYPPTTFAYTDKMHGKFASYFPVRDYIGCVEVRRLYEGDWFSKVPLKKIYVNHSEMWKQGCPIYPVDMTFGYDYQRLYILFCQSIDGNKTYRAWLSMFDTNLPNETLLKDPMIFPVFNLVSQEFHTHPFAPQNMEEVIDYLQESGCLGVRIGQLTEHPQLMHQLFNVLSAHDRLFVTFPVMFTPPPHIHWPYEYRGWRPEDSRMLYQVMLMIDETHGRVMNAAIVGGVSTWHEDWKIPYPDIEPKRPLKTRMALIDETVYWKLEALRDFDPVDYPWKDTKEIPSGHHLMKSYWENADPVYPDHLWQPLGIESILVDDLIEYMDKPYNTTYLAPVRFRSNQFYVHNPLNTDLYHKSLPDWSGQKALGTIRDGVIEYNVKYHNFKRKILSQAEQILIPYDVYIPFPKQTFLPSSGTYVVDDPNERPYKQTLRLPRGIYHVVARGADGGPAYNTNIEAIVASGGQAATIELDITTEAELKLDIWVGNKGKTPAAGAVDGGRGSQIHHVFNPPDTPRVPYINEVIDNGGVFELPWGRAGATFWFIPAGSKNIRLHCIDGCGAKIHNTSLFVMKADGTLLTGATPRSGSPNPPASGESIWGVYADPITDEEINKSILSEYPDFAINGFNFNSTKANNGKDVPPYDPNLQNPGEPTQSFTVEGITINWTGNQFDCDLEPQSGENPMEDLWIPNVTEDLIIGGLTSDGGKISALWDFISDPPAQPQPEDCYLKGGGGGGLTGIFIAGSPFAIAGSGGGGGCPNESTTATDTENNGGHGGDSSGGYGTLGGTDIVAPGTQTDGYKQFKGQSVEHVSNTAGGGGAGYWGGKADCTPDTYASPGGGGGSSYIGSHDAITVTSQVVTPGSSYPMGNPQDGFVTVEGNEVITYYDTTFAYKLLDHHLGDFFYQCAGTSDELDVRFHIFAVENLSCHTSIKDFHLKSTNPDIKLGIVPTFQNGYVEQPPRPDQDELFWEEIPPNSEVIFAVTADLLNGNYEDCTFLTEGVTMSYYLESNVS